MALTVETSNPPFGVAETPFLEVPQPGLVDASVAPFPTSEGFFAETPFVSEYASG